MCTSAKAAEVGEIMKGLLPGVLDSQVEVVTRAVNERLRSEHRSASEFATMYALEDVLYDLEHSSVVSVIEAIKERAKRIRADIDKRAEEAR